MQQVEVSQCARSLKKNAVIDRKTIADRIRSKEDKKILERPHI